MSIQDEIRNEIVKNSKMCLRPFEYMMVELNGNVFSCCHAYTQQYYFGNVFKNSFNQIWNGKKWNNLRKDILQDNYTHCHLDLCYGLEKWCFIDKKDIKQLKYPKYVSLCVDTACNVVCAFCREKIKYAYPHFTKSNLRANKIKQILKKLNLYKKNDTIINTDKISKHHLEMLIAEAEYTKNHINKIDNFYMPMLQEAKILMLDGSGEIFVSEFCKKLLARTTVEYPNMKYQIMTNGLLCDEKHLKELNILDKLDLAVVSIHAATEETYKKIVKCSDFNKVIENIKYLVKLKEQNKVSDVVLTFVISSLNYQDLPKFVELAHSLGANPQMWEVRDVNNCQFCRDINKYNICSKSHPEHEKFLEVLKNPVFKKYNVITNDFISEME